MINIIGLGYIGLPTALMLAASGNKVVGSDIMKDKVIALRSGKMPFKENGLYELWQQAYEYITFDDKCIVADYYIISVSTPYDKTTKRINATYVVKAVRDVLKVAPCDAVLIIESTIPPGTIDKYIRPIVEESELNINIVHAPERIIPGKLITELESNSRTIGADKPEVAEKVKDIYATFCKGEIICTDIRTAEMTKVVENTYRDINIAFANELVRICNADSLNVHEIIRIANKHPRVNILSPGPGVGGHCIPIDPWFLVGDYPTLANLVREARKVNDLMPEYVLERTVEIMKKNKICDTSKVGFYGMTYKENVDDIRESPTLQLLETMEKHLSNSPRVYDPYIKDTIVPNQVFSFEHFLEGLEMIVIMVAHKEIICQQSLLKSKVVLDTRNVIFDINTYKL